LHKRPSLQEAINLFKKYADNDTCSEVLQEYYDLKSTNEFLASRIIVEYADHWNHVRKVA